MKRVCIFLGANPGNTPEYEQEASRMGGTLARLGLELIYGGANMGCMATLANSALKAGATVHGVIPRTLLERERAHTGLSQLHVVDSMHQRKAKMAELADGFVALPGGIGTLEEFFEVYTWAQLGFHTKPCGLLNVRGFFNPLIAMLDSIAEQGFLLPAHREMVLIQNQPEPLLQAMINYTPAYTPKWITGSDQL